MKLLALDTSSDACSAAVLTGEACFSELEITPRAHTRLILPMIESVLKQATLQLSELDAIAFGCGPGAFTGVRIATGIAQGLALAANKPLMPVSTLAALAQKAYQETKVTQVLVALDARMGEMYWGQYSLQAGRMQLENTEQVIAPTSVPLPNRGQWLGVGSAWSVYADDLAEHLAAYLSTTPALADYLPEAKYIAELARLDSLATALAPELAQPVYLRNKVAQTTLERTGLSV